MVVTEANPQTMENYFNDFNFYFGTVLDFCKKYDKPVIYLDSLSDAGFDIEDIVGISGGIYASKKSFDILKEENTRREMIKNTAKMFGGIYFFLGSFINGAVIKSLTYGLNDREEAWKDEKYYINHIVDQRNVEITERILKLPDLIDPELFNNGDYVLTNFGAAHTIGIEHYLKHPIQRKIKSALYSFNYDLIDNDEIILYKPKEKKWEKTILNLP